jgi:hypothetical protein
MTAPVKGEPTTIVGDIVTWPDGYSLKVSKHLVGVTPSWLAERPERVTIDRDGVRIWPKDTRDAT